MPPIKPQVFPYSFYHYVIEPSEEEEGRRSPHNSYIGVSDKKDDHEDSLDKAIRKIFHDEVNHDKK